MNYGWWLATALLISVTASAQQIEKVQPAAAVRHVLLSKPVGVAREVGAASRDFVTFRDPQWSALTIGQIAAASEDAATSLSNLHNCPSCSETGISKLLIGRHPDAHKYILAGAMEIGVEAVMANYFRNHGPRRKLYWRVLWALPQSFSLYEHARAADHNAALDLRCFSPGSSCK